MFTFTRHLFMPLLMSLESFRRGQAGALMMGIFISINPDAITPTYQRLDMLTTLAEVGLTLIEELPPAVQWIATPFYDYTKAIL